MKKTAAFLLTITGLSFLMLAQPAFTKDNPCAPNCGPPPTPTPTPTGFPLPPTDGNLDVGGTEQQPTNPMVDLPVTPPNPNLGLQNAEEALTSVRDAMNLFADDGATRAKGFLGSNAATGVNGNSGDKLGLSKAGFGGDGKDKALANSGLSAPNSGLDNKAGPVSTVSFGSPIGLADSGSKDKKLAANDADDSKTAAGLGNSDDSDLDEGGTGSAGYGSYNRRLAGGTGEVEAGGAGNGKGSGDGSGDDYFSKNHKLTLFEVVSRRYAKWGRELDR